MLKPHAFLRAIQILGRSRFRIFQALARRIGVAKSRNIAFETTFDGEPYVGSLSQAIDRHIYFLGCYAKEELRLLDIIAAVMRPLRDTICFVDIGANVGQHSLYMSKRADEVFSFEPQEEAVTQLEKNIRLNNITNIKVFACALGDKDCDAHLGSGFDGNNGSRSITWTLDAAKNTPIKVLQADRLFREARIAKVDIIRMDVEGYEKNVFAGMHSIIFSDRPIIMFELVGNEIKGGFESLDELKAHLYPDHALFGVEAGFSNTLAKFDWSRHEEAVCFPSEILKYLTAHVPSLIPVQTDSHAPDTARSATLAPLAVRWGIVPGR